MYEYCADWREGKLVSTHDREAATQRLQRDTGARHGPRGRSCAVADASILLGVSVQRVRALLGQGRIPGARRVKGAWRIPMVHENGAWTVRATMAQRGPQAHYAELRAPF